jgi:hypothetical protein
MRSYFCTATKEDPEGQFVQCYCDATIALPVLSQALAERLGDFERDKKLSWPANRE